MSKNTYPLVESNAINISSTFNSASLTFMFLMNFKMVNAHYRFSIFDDFKKITNQKQIISRYIVETMGKF